jgi:hypothetical protein
MKPKLITYEAYKKKMDKIIRKGMNRTDTLVSLLNEACKYKIKEKDGRPKV